MPLHVDRDLPRAAGFQAKCGEYGQPIRIGLINNMPDAALRATERQFVSLLTSAAEHVEVHLFFYSLPGIVRAASGRRYTETEYLSAKDLPQSRLDAVIVTGCEPRAADLREEPYWNDLTGVLEWADQNTHSAIWSCLAAHAAILHFDGIDRRRRSQKRFGVFECTRIADDPLMDGVSAAFPVPHSRWNDVPERQLIDCGYRVLSRDRSGSVDAFSKRRKSLFLFFQGHPEYDADALLREYRRDAARYRNNETDAYPAIPEGYFDAETANILTSARDKTLSSNCKEDRGSVLSPQLGKSIVNTWRYDATRIYRNWIGYLCAQKAAGPAALSR
jgi:homoserine O-succinyltransferase/O-acetyltransferase